MIYGATVAENALPPPVPHLVTRFARLSALMPRLRRLLLMVVAVLALAPVVLTLPLNFVQPPTTAMILWRSVQRLAEGKRPIYPRRDVVARDQVSPHLRRAVLASEDDRFYLHFGFDFEEIGKAIERRQAGGRLRGASTITQQVAKNLFLWEGRSYVRKGAEAWITLVLEVCLSKERILDLYLNLAEWGDGIFGAEMAARTHFRKSARNLTREEAARLAAILPSPRRWPVNGSVATRRAAIVLDRMAFAPPR
jgi:monofunctional biosynthetic peptidoglycan transglycosylase